MKRLWNSFIRLQRRPNGVRPMTATATRSAWLYARPSIHFHLGMPHDSRTDIPSTTRAKFTHTAVTSRNPSRHRNRIFVGKSTT